MLILYKIPVSAGIFFLMSKLPEQIKTRYKELKQDIKNRLEEFTNVAENKYFYELCFCICTPQSKAANAFIVQKVLEQKKFLTKPFKIEPLLRKKENYIRFHNTKAKRLLQARKIYPKVLEILSSDLSPAQKRDWIVTNVNGIGMKEASHFLRNIGYRNLAILDRHILKHLVLCGLYNEVPKLASKKDYLAVEKRFLQFSKQVKIPVDELDLLFWSYETGTILK